MALRVHSLFYYGHKIDETNNLINFKEGAGPEKTASVPVGSYTMTKFFEVLISALNSASTLTWGYSLNRTTRVVTITASSAASLLFATGTNFFNSPSELMGFTQTDLLGLTIFVGNFGSGFSWAPQFPLQDYTPKTTNKRLLNAAVNKSATGDTVTVQNFGFDRLIKFNAKYINDFLGEGILQNDPFGVENAISFMDYVVEKHPVEFMENSADPLTFDKVYLESTPRSQDGTTYELIENLGQNLPGYFETGILTFKVINLE